MNYPWLCSLLGVLWLGSLQAATFRGLDGLAGANGSYAWGVSGDGAVVVGQSMAAEGSQAVRWNQQGRVSGLGYLPGGNDSLAKGASRDGSVIAGISSQYDPERGLVTGWWGFGWSAGSGMQSLGPGIAQRVNASGTVIVGELGSFDHGNQACRWISGVAWPLSGFSASGLEAVECRDVSDDGLVAVGTRNERAYRWTAGQGPVDLGTLPGELFSEAYGISGDGQYVVGVGYGVGPAQAFRWSQRDGMVRLGAVPDADTSRANAVSADGNIVVGLSAGAFVWDPTHGMRSVKEVLTRAGIDLSEWGLDEATGVSDDGRTLVGLGLYHGNSRAWVATVEDLTLPDLSITCQGAECGLTWPGLQPFNLWRLQSATQLTGPWTDEQVVPTWSEGQYHVSLLKEADRRFYRLVK